MPHIHMNIHISDTAMLCDAEVGIHTVQHMTLYLQINKLTQTTHVTSTLSDCTVPPPPPHIWDMSIVTIIWLPLVANFVFRIHLVVPPSDLVGSERDQY